MRYAVFLSLLIGVTACSREQASPPTGQELSAEGVVTVDGAALPYRIVGRGRPCIVFGSPALYGESFSPTLTRQLRCVHFGARAFVPGAPRRGVAPYGVLEAVEDIEAVRDELDVGPFVLMGHSIGGLVVMAYAARYPEQVTHVVAIGAPPSVPFAYDSARAYREREMSPGRVAQHEANLTRVDSLEAAHPGRGFIPRYLANAALYWADSTYDATALFEGVGVNDPLFDELQQTPFGWADELPQVRVPVFLALGRFDFVVTPNVWAGVETPFRDLTVHLFQKAGHWPQVEDPDEFDATVLEWIASRDEGPAGG